MTASARQAAGRPPLPRARDAQRALGAFYTPPDVAEALTRWALRDSAGPVLDPSYGTCRFLDAAVDVMEARGDTAALSKVHGIDIDSAATTRTRQALVGRGASVAQFTHRDFFDCAPSPSYAAVLGNPPYVRHHWQTDRAKAAVAEAMKAAGVALSGLASLWAPFVVHADRFVTPAGRMALVLPGSALQADYVAPLWRHLAARYRIVTLLRVGERVFTDAQEETVILLADHRADNTSTRNVLVTEIPCFADVRSALLDDPALEVTRRSGHRLQASRRPLTSRRLMSVALEHEACFRLREVATIRLGTVTGANAFFVRSGADQLLADLKPSATVPVVARSKWLTGAMWTTADDEARAAEPQPSRLLHLGPLESIPSGLRDAIEAGERDDLHLRSHCSRRGVWWQLPQQPAPDAFLPYMMGRPKGMTANRSGAGCINGVHQVRWLPAVGGDDYVLSTWTSLWALGMEQTCRHYAGGVLKLEPGKAPALPVVKLDDAAALTELDSTLRTRGIVAARAHADELVLRGVLGFTARQCAVLRDLVDELSARRTPPIRA